MQVLQSIDQRADLNHMRRLCRSLDVVITDTHVQYASLVERLTGKAIPALAHKVGRLRVPHIAHYDHYQETTATRADVKAVIAALLGRLRQGKAHFHALLQRFDADHDGVLQSSEFESLLEFIGVPVDAGTLAHLLPMYGFVPQYSHRAPSLYWVRAWVDVHASI